jgi:hypothetical protein
MQLMGGATFTAMGDGVPLASDPNNQAAQFNGFDASMVAPGLASKCFTSEATLMAWVRFDQLPSQAGRITSIVGKSGFARDLDLQAETDNRFHFYVATGDPYQVVSRTVVQANQWYFVVATYQAEDSIQIYVNGALENTTSIPDVIRQENSNPVAIGASAFWPGRFFPGAIGEVAAFDKALDSADVNNLWVAAGAGGSGDSSSSGSPHLAAHALRASNRADAAVLVGLTSKSAPPGDWDASGTASAPSDDRPVKSVASAPAVGESAAVPVAPSVLQAPIALALARAAKDRLFGAWAAENSSLEPLAWPGTVDGDLFAVGMLAEK